MQKKHKNAKKKHYIKFIFLTKSPKNKNENAHYLSFGPFSTTLSDLTTTAVQCTRSNGNIPRQALRFTGVLLKGTRVELIT